MTLLLDEPTPAEAIDAALAEMERRSEQRGRFSKHLELCAVCSQGGEELCAEGTRLLRAAVGIN